APSGEGSFQPSQENPQGS
nr:Chain I, deamidated DQ8-glia-alpha1 peptide [Triticum aestivum]4Z7U_J Chain J, deamidated DQ8-glia-alpha1 peptide [Triticum aestivum]4Z7V_I Chain I, deamidated DQ8-glia-alpha1 peptide [Triticum aestivum]4Z7V_J Chain J, deamidated DQ8-glia-alpha1 peptide [Triticum aestivum]4Z7W_I Chain I, DQ8-glia-alpha1 [Triticum aestivum]4Z7W_J Chain J, DQ8-glia-alpha1 [Triticum aestivum]